MKKVFNYTLPTNYIIKDSTGTREIKDGKLINEPTKTTKDSPTDKQLIELDNAITSHVSYKKNIVTHPYYEKYLEIRKTIKITDIDQRKKETLKECWRRRWRVTQDKKRIFIAHPKSPYHK